MTFIITHLHRKVNAQGIQVLFSNLTLSVQILYTGKFPFLRRPIINNRHYSDCVKNIMRGLGNG
jgi:hypothetical protein